MNNHLKSKVEGIIRSITEALVLALVTLAVLMAQSVQGAVMTYQEGVADYAMDAAEARQNDPDSTHDSKWNLDVGSLTATNGAVRSYLSFNLTGLPANAVITNITLSLTVTDEGNLGARAIELHRITAAGPIVETGLTWNKYDSTHNWAKPGGDFDPTVLSTLSQNQTSGVQIWPSSAAFVAAAQAALKPSVRLELILLSPPAEAAGGVSYKGYGADDSISARPLLSVEYTIISP